MKIQQDDKLLNAIIKWINTDTVTSLERPTGALHKQYYIKWIAFSYYLDGKSFLLYDTRRSFPYI